MAFYGLLVGVSLLISLSAIAVIGVQASKLGSLAQQYSEYGGTLLVSAFAQAANATAPQANSTYYQGWLASVRASAYEDGLDVAVADGSLVLSTSSRLHLAQVVRT